MHRTITIVAACLLFFAFPRILSEEIKIEKIKSVPNDGNIHQMENIPVVITEIKPMASELKANNNETIKHDSPMKAANATLEKIEVLKIPLDNIAKKGNTSEVEKKELKQETNTVEHHVSTPKSDLVENFDQVPSEDQSQKDKEIVSGSQTIEKLKNEIQQAKDDLSTKTKRLEELKKRASNAQQLSDKAEDHLKSLVFVLNNLQESIIHSSKAAFETDWQLQLQTAMYNDAKRKYARLSRELDMIKTDYEKTKVAAENAMTAAKIAQKNIGTSEENLSMTNDKVKLGKLFIGYFGSH